MDEVPLYVPVELGRAGADPEALRWFRLAIGIGPTSLRLRSALPEELRQGSVTARLHLPLDLDPPPPPLCLLGVAEEVVVDAGEETERAEPRLLRFQQLGETERALIEQYITLRSQPTAP